MTSVLNTNMASLQVQKNLAGAQNSLSKSVERLSSGLRINHAADDAAGMAMANMLQSQLANQSQSMRNIGDALSVLQVAESAFTATTELAQRVVTLAVQGKSDTNTSDQRKMLSTEMSKLMTAIDNIGQRTTYGSKALLSGTGTAINVQMSGTAADQLTLDASNFATIGKDAGLGKTLSDALSALDAAAGSPTDAQWGAVIDAANAYIADLSSRRANIGAQQNQLEYSLSNLNESSTSTAAAKSRILDTDYASEMSQMTKNQILQQAATAMMSQANQMPNTVLSLIKG